jgi:hypothetical protein
MKEAEGQKETFLFVLTKKHSSKTIPRSQQICGQ